MPRKQQNYCLSTKLTHKGIVQSVDGQNIRIRVIAQSACAGCHSKGACSLSDSQEKEIEVSAGNQSFSPGEAVNVWLQPSSGLKAVILGYILPLFLLLFTLIVIYSITTNELESGLISLSILIPYYFILWVYRSKIKDSLKISIEKLT